MSEKPPSFRHGIAFLLPFLAPLIATELSAQPFSDPGLGVGAHVAVSPSGSGHGGVTTGGFDVRARLTGGLGLEGALSYRKESLSVAGENVLSLTEIPVQLSAMLFLCPTWRVQPYAAAGISYVYVRAEGTGSNAPAGRSTENKFAFHAAGGADVRVARRLSVFAEARYVILDVDAAAALEKTHGSRPTTNYWHGAVGLMFYF